MIHPLQVPSSRWYMNIIQDSVHEQSNTKIVFTTPLIEYFSLPGTYMVIQSKLHIVIYQNLETQIQKLNNEYPIVSESVRERGFQNGVVVSFPKSFLRTFN